MLIIVENKEAREKVNLLINYIKTNEKDLTTLLAILKISE